jgi:hypothetical protein
MDHKRLIIALPYIQPQMYFRAGLVDTIAGVSTSSDVSEDLSPYLHYGYDAEGAMCKLFRSNQPVCQSIPN